jgi:hypothetical protein
MTKAPSPVPPLMLVVLPPEAAQQVVDHLVKVDKELADDLAAIRQKYEPLAAPPARRSAAPRPRRTPPQAAA